MELLPLFIGLGIAFSASRIPLKDEPGASWLVWAIGLSIIVGAGALVGFVLFQFSALAGATGNRADITSARQGSVVITLIFLLMASAPHSISLLFRATDRFWARIVPAPANRHWLIFGALIAINFGFSAITLALR